MQPIGKNQCKATAEIFHIIRSVITLSGVAKFWETLLSAILSSFTSIYFILYLFFIFKNHTYFWFYIADSFFSIKAMLYDNFNFFLVVNASQYLMDNHCINLSEIQKYNWDYQSALVAHLDAPSDSRPGGRRFIPLRGRQHSFVETDHERFSTVILFLPLIQEGQLSVSGERMCTILVNRLED